MISQLLDAQHLSEHPSPGRLRIEAWMSLQRAAEELEVPSQDAADGREAAHLVLTELESLEQYWARPGAGRVRELGRLLAADDRLGFAREVFRAVSALAVDPARVQGAESEDDDDALEPSHPPVTVLVVDPVGGRGRRRLERGMAALRRPEDEFRFDVLVVPSFEDAVFAISFNHEIQACVVRDGFPLASDAELPALEPLQRRRGSLDRGGPAGRALALGEMLADLRPELDLYLFTDVAVDRLPATTHRIFRRVFFRQDHLIELHLSLLEGLRARYDAPFFDAVRRHSRRPIGVFHALPVSRGGSVVNSLWTRDMADFYGLGLFLAETSATSGLDSLLRPRGTLRDAQRLASRAFGSDATYFVTNGTSTANKVVLEALVEPGDVVLIDRACHTSHHYAMVNAGAHPVYLDAYELGAYSISGAVTVRTLKRALLELRRAGRLERVRAVVLTNCTFDGIVYDALRVMEECLAIAPHLTFLWDEAWFAFAVASPTYRQRTAMHAAGRLRERLASEATAVARRRLERRLAGAGDEAWLEERLVPDPAAARVRVYATQSTHKSLSSLRQGSMIHVRDDVFGTLVRDRFEEAYRAHTSTSPNYQILASLDVARRQVELEGYALVQAAIEKAVTIRRAIATDRLLRASFRVLGVPDLIPPASSAVLQGAAGPEGDAFRIERGWAEDEFVLDPTRITLYTGGLGIDGRTFRDVYLMARLGVQVNKTSPNTVLLMTGIGTTWSSVAFLLDGLRRLARELSNTEAHMSPAELGVLQRRRRRLTQQPLPLPPFAGFAARFRPHPGSPEGDLRAAYLRASHPGACRHMALAEVAARAGADELVAAGFITPYPPGFPVLVPGQLVDRATAEYLAGLDVEEIHGYEPELGIPLIADAPAGSESRAAPAEYPAVSAG